MENENNVFVLPGWRGYGDFGRQRVSLHSIAVVVEKEEDMGQGKEKGKGKGKRVGFV